MFGHGKPHSKNLEKLHLPGLKPDSDLTLPPIRKAFQWEWEQEKMEKVESKLIGNKFV